jgi:hypothetical protein
MTLVSCSSTTVLSRTLASAATIYHGSSMNAFCGANGDDLGFATSVLPRRNERTPLLYPASVSAGSAIEDCGATSKEAGALPLSYPSGIRLDCAPPREED